MASSRPTETGYFDRITAARTASLSQEDLTAGNALVSAETFEAPPPSLDDVLMASPELVFRHLRKLTPFDQDLVLSHLFVRKAQVPLGSLFGILQSNLSGHIRNAFTRLGRATDGSEPYTRKPKLRYLHDDFWIDPPALGQFRVDVQSDGFRHLFTPVGNNLNSDFSPGTPTLGREVKVARSRDEHSKPISKRAKGRLSKEHVASPGKKLGRPLGSRNRQNL